MKTDRKINVHLVEPPCGIRPFWEAYFDGEEGEETAPRGTGSTAEEATEDLLEMAGEG